MRSFFVACILTTALAIPWTDDPLACSVPNHAPSYGVLCSLGSRGVCNGTTVIVSSDGPQCAGNVRFSIDAHGRHDVRWREASRDPGPCGRVTFAAESLTPRTLSALSVRSSCASRACSPRNVTVRTAGVSQCSSAEVAGECSEPTVSIVSKKFPNDTVCPGLIAKVSGGLRWKVQTKDFGSESIRIRQDGSGINITFAPIVAIPAPSGLTVLAGCVDGDQSIEFIGSCDPMAYAGWCSLGSGATPCFQPNAWTPGETLTVSTSVSFAAASYPSGSHAVPRTDDAQSVVTCTSGCTDATALLTIPPAPSRPPPPPSPPPNVTNSSYSCGPQTVCIAESCGMTAYGGQSVCANVCAPGSFNMSLVQVGLANTTIQTISSSGAGCSSFGFDSPITSEYALVFDGPIDSANFSFGVSASLQSSAVVRCLSGPCENNAKISGGTDAPYTQFMVSLRTPANTHFCGATLLTPKIVLTAAHCAVYALQGGFAIAGAADLSNPFVGTEVAIVGTAWHANYSDATHDNDIGLIVLAESFAQNPVTLDANPQSHAAVFGALNGNFAVVAMGWGTDDKGLLQGKLQMAALTVASRDKCSDLFGSMSADGICVGDGVGKVQVCPGDSGGPLLWLDELDITTNTLLASTQIGIVSWGGACQVNFCKSNDLTNITYCSLIHQSIHLTYRLASHTRFSSICRFKGTGSTRGCWSYRIRT